MLVMAVNNGEYSDIVTFYFNCLVANFELVFYNT